MTNSTRSGPRRLRDRFHAVSKCHEAIDRRGGFAVVTRGTPIERIFERDRLRARLPLRPRLLLQRYRFARSSYSTQLVSLSDLFFIA